MPMNSNTIVALVGNPNCGKTTLFNQLTKNQQRVGNWAGVTIEKKSGLFKHQNESIQVVDLPGVYSLIVPNSDKHALDEQITCHYLLNKEAHLVVNIVDSSNLTRHLYLTLELLEMGIPCIIALNMMDIAKKKHLNIDCAALAKCLGCPVVPMTCHKRQGLDELKKCIFELSKNLPQTTSPCVYTDEINQSLHSLKRAIAQHHDEIPTLKSSDYRVLAIRLLEKDQWAKKIIADTKIATIANETIDILEKNTTEDSDIIIADCRYRFVMEIIQACIRVQTANGQRFFCEHFDRIAMHGIWGIPFFLGIMYLVFEFSIGLASLFAPIFDDGTHVLFVDGSTYLAQQLALPARLSVILTQGLGVGLNTVFSFIPQIGLMFLALSFLEDSGYMARAAFVMDRLMQALGLPGKSFIPLLIGFGCNVPSVMATRTLQHTRDRILTAMMAPFMSCGARLAIFVVFGSTFFPEHAGFLIFVLYILGIFIAMLTAWLLKITLLRGNVTPFILEVPNYHWPTLRNLITQSWQRAKAFIWRAGKIIVPICILLGGLNSIDMRGHLASLGSNNTILANIGCKLTPVLQPMGIQQNNWPATVGLFTGALAKEVVLGTLNTLYAQQPEQQQLSTISLQDLEHELKAIGIDSLLGFKQIFSMQTINPFTANMTDSSMSAKAMSTMSLAFASKGAAFCYLLFILLYIPCISTIAVIAREIGAGWAWFSSAWSINIAYSAAVICYQLLVCQQQPLTASIWISGILIWQTGWFFALKWVANHHLWTGRSAHLLT